MQMFCESRTPAGMSNRHSRGQCFSICPQLIAQFGKQIGNNMKVFITRVTSVLMTKNYLVYLQAINP